ncbi:hypothetical protein AB0L06_28130 [Spirillospora sp. NPDC052269]
MYAHRVFSVTIGGALGGPNVGGDTIEGDVSWTARSTACDSPSAPQGERDPQLDTLGSV